MSSDSVQPVQKMFLGARDTLPLILAAVPFGILYGVLAKASGLSAWATIGMSVLVFAGSSQFIAVTMLASAVAWPAILLTTFFVNLRHMLYAAALVPHVRHLPELVKAKMAFWLTDETFAVVSDWLRKNSDEPGLEWYYFGSGLLMYGNWILCTFIGLTLGQSLPGMESWGLEVAMIVAFVGIVAPALTNPPMWACAAAASVCAVLTWGWSNQSGLIISGLVGVAAGVVMEKLEENKKVAP
ncbi:AzlC family ABC transporter permease [Sansalvadorimonas sp. 2012CJ34-2]|uniref:AzlC family ABC transporter permease n=1 Tax=Parendozoicomonas callyspongiae TaxID=2942213 RepID=A0ABT0PH84_9GAMM|nr:AzlC family ABC transporter permease [Sansalvadorimonas sp. 2012CJ34-2]MCL6270371.1 AzlC family ABC transporter permease [Sansalvadorimonas sp. 2012CJ34-2]